MKGNIIFVDDHVVYLFSDSGVGLYNQIEFTSFKTCDISKYIISDDDLFKVYREVVEILCDDNDRKAKIRVLKVEFDRY